MEIRQNLREGHFDLRLVPNPEQALKARVAKLEPLGGGTMVMHLRTPRSKLLRFLAGQRVRVDLGDGLSDRLELLVLPDETDPSPDGRLWHLRALGAAADAWRGFPATGGEPSC